MVVDKNILTIHHSYHPFSLFTTYSQYFSPILTIYNPFSLFITYSHYLLPILTISHPFSLFITHSHYLSPILTIYQCDFFLIFLISTFLRNLKFLSREKTRLMIQQREIFSYRFNVPKMPK